MFTKKIVVAITGASGSIYAKVLLDKLSTLSQEFKVGVVMSANAKIVWEHELGNKDYSNYKFMFYDKLDFNAPFASGSAGYCTMFICPCSMGTLGRISAGISDDLITRAADVILKERRKLIIIPRETPYSLLHLKNMVSITESGGIVCPATPSFYSIPNSFEDLASTVIDRALQLAGIELSNTYRWGEKG